MKKLGLVAVFSVLLLAGCSAESSDKASSNSSSATAETTVETVSSSAAVDAPAGKYSDQKDTGEGSVTVRALSKVVNKAQQPYLSFVIRDFDEDKSTFVYIDGEMNDVRYMTPANDQLVLGEGEAAAEVGTHTIEFVQTDNDKEGGSITTYKSAVYEVKK